MALPNYPNNPSVNDTFVNGGVTFQWDGEKWKALSNANNSLTAQLADPDSTVLVGGVAAARLSDGTTTTLRAQGWTFGEDIAPYIESAASQGFKRLLLGKGGYDCSEVTLTSAFQTMEICGVGSGFAYTPQTTIRPASPAQTDIFISQEGVSGVDNLKFSGINFVGLGTCGYAVRQLSGAGWVYEDLQASGFTEWVLWSQQGLNHYGRMFLRGGTNGGAIAMYSDFFAENLEVTGGAVGIRVMAGGGRLSNILANSQSDCCFELSPLDENTNHINTAVSGLYAGEVYNPDEKPIIRIKGNSVRRVTDVQMSNIHTVSAAVAGQKHNWHIECEKADRVTINGLAALGIGAFETSDLFDAGGIRVTDSTAFNLSSGTIHNLSRSPFVVNNSELSLGSGVSVSDWGGAFADALQSTAVVCQDETSKINISSGCSFSNARISATKVGFGQNGADWSIGQLSFKLAGTTAENAFSFASNSAPWSSFSHAFGSGDVGKIEVFGRRVTYTGTFNTNGAGDYTIKTIPSTSEDKCYSVSIQQVGTGANATSGMVFANLNALGAITSGNTNATASLQNSFKVNGSDLEVGIGSGYGPTTWRYQITRIL